MSNTGDGKVTIYDADPIQFVTAKKIAEGYRSPDNLYYFRIGENFTLKNQIAQNLRSGVNYLAPLAINNLPLDPPITDDVAQVDSIVNLQLETDLEKINDNKSQELEIQSQTQSISNDFKNKLAWTNRLNNMQLILCLSKQRIKRLIQLNGADNLPLTPDQIKTLSNTNSKSWYHGNMKSTPLHLSNTDKSLKKPMDVMATDIMAKFPSQSRHGNHWCVLFVCVITGFLLPVFTKTKDQSSITAAFR